MVNELEFVGNENLYPLYQRDPDAYRALLQQHGIALHPELIEKARKTAAVHTQPTYPNVKNTPVVAGGEE
jgi:hypothetical protein